MRAAVLVWIVVMLNGCAGQKQQSGTSASVGFSASAPVDVIRVLDSEFVRNPSTMQVSSGLFQQPVALAVAANGDIVMADQGSGQIIKTDTRGNLLGSTAYFDPRGLATTRAPRFVRADYNGNVYVTDAVNAQIAIYDSRLHPVSSILPPYDALEMAEGSISGLAFSSFGEFFASDMLNGRIFRFDASGRFLAEIPSKDDASAPLHRPMGLACSDLDGSILVCESGTSQIAVFDNLGAPVRTFGGSDLKNPVAIALDKQGRCYVADVALNAIVIFAREGRYLGRLDAGRIGFADFGAPTDVTISDGSLYIADPSHGRILQIRFGVEPPAP